MASFDVFECLQSTSFYVCNFFCQIKKEIFYESKI